MACQVDLAALFLRYVSVNLSSGELLVAQQLLNASQVGTPIQEVGREGMSQHVRRHLLVDLQSLRVLPHQGLDAALGETPSLHVQEKGRRGTPPDEARTSFFQVVRHGTGSRGPHQGDSFLGPLPLHSYLSSLLAYVANVQSYQLANPDAGSV